MIKHLRFAAALLAAAIVSLQLAPAAAAERGITAASFDLQGPKGPVSLSAYHGKLVYLDFWASWCGPCRRSFPWMNQMQSKYGPAGLQIVAVNLDAKHEDATRFLSSVPADFTIGFDPEGSIAARYGIKGMPSSVLIGPSGAIVTTHTGFNEADKGGLENLIKQNLPASAAGK